MYKGGEDYITHPIKHCLQARRHVPAAQSTSRGALLGPFSPLPSWRTQTHHFLPPPVQIPPHSQILIIFNVQSN